MFKTVDARGRTCPEPVILTKKALEEVGDGPVLVMVDSEAALENVSRLANGLGRTLELEQDGGEYRLLLAKARGQGDRIDKTGGAGLETGLSALRRSGQHEREATDTGAAGNIILEGRVTGAGVEDHATTLLLSSETLGHGDDDLGKVLIRNFFLTLSQVDNPPQCLIFINSAVKLACDGSAVLQQLQELEDKGTEVSCCGTCLEFYRLKESLQVGSITNMFAIAEVVSSGRLVTL